MDRNSAFRRQICALLVFQMRVNRHELEKATPPQRELMAGSQHWGQAFKCSPSLWGPLTGCLGRSGGCWLGLAPTTGLLWPLVGLPAIAPQMAYELTSQTPQKSMIFGNLPAKINHPEPYLRAPRTGVAAPARDLAQRQPETANAPDAPLSRECVNCQSSGRHFRRLSTMPCSRTSAIRRLVNLYAQRLAAEPDFNERVSLADVLRETNVHAVAEHNLYPEFDHELEPQSVADDRDIRLLKAWLSPRRANGSLQ